MWSDLHFGDHTRTLGLSNARIRPSFLRDVAQKKWWSTLPKVWRSIWSRPSRCYLNDGETIGVSSNGRRTNSGCCELYFSQIHLSPSYQNDTIISYYIHIIITYHLSPLYHNIPWLSIMISKWYHHFCGAKLALPKVSKLCATGNTGSWGGFFFQKKEWR